MLTEILNHGTKECNRYNLSVGGTVVSLYFHYTFKKITSRCKMANSTSFREKKGYNVDQVEEK